MLSSNSLETLIYITLIAVAAMVLYGAAEAVRGVLVQRAAARQQELESLLAAAGGIVGPDSIGSFELDEG